MRDWPRLRLISLSGLLVALLVIWGLTWQRLRSEAALLEQGELGQQQSLAVIVSENLSQMVDRGRLMALTGDEWFEGQTGDAASRLAVMLAADQAYLRIALYDTSLRELHASSPAAHGPFYSERLRAVARDMPGSASVAVIVAPELEGNSWQVPLLFKIQKGSELRGYLLAVLDLGYLLRLYRNIDIGRSGAIHILAPDGRSVAEARRAGLVLPEKPTQLGQFLASGGEEGFLKGPLVPQGPVQLASYRRAERTPFMVVVSRSTDEVQASHRQSSLRIWGVQALLSGFLLFLAWWLMRALRRQESLYTSLKRADEEKHLLIAELEEQRQKALLLASSDHLTGLNNRRMFNELAASHLAQARRSLKHHALVYLDLDRFKLINDTLGHHVGDLLLQAFAERLRASMRSADILGRMGGDEFAVLVIDLDDPADMDAIAVKLMARLSQPYHLEGHEIQSSPSAGIVFFPRDGHDVATLCRNADAAMYESKRAGRGRYRYYEAHRQVSGERRLTLERELPRAIAQGDFVLHYQPKVSLSDFRITGFEALVRWQHPSYGLVYPNDFIGVAEESGLIVELGDWVVRSCCAQLAQWKSLGLPVVPLACNVSPRQLREEGLPARVAQALQNHGLTAQDLEIEITESCLVEPIDGAVKVLEALQAQGVRIALDDFGSGFSSLSQIRQLPIHTIKIDRSFVNDLRGRKDVGVIVTSIITLAHNLGLKVVAEGVELSDQLLALKTAGCDEVQGYFLSRPLAPAEAGQLMLQGVLNPP